MSNLKQHIPLFLLSAMLILLAVLYAYTESQNIKLGSRVAAYERCKTIPGARWEEASNGYWSCKQFATPEPRY